MSLLTFKKLPSDFDEMVRDMLLCSQNPHQSVYEHGVSVFKHYQKLIQYLKGDNSVLDNWKKPKWLDLFKGNFLENLHEHAIVEQYLIYHDCGKPYCRQEDKLGKVHFPNHAEVSKEVWVSVNGDDTVAKLIAYDMIIHTDTSERINALLQNDWSKQDSLTLLLAALCEIHSNAKMFGGIQTVSFLSKLKTLERRGMQICKFWFESVHSGR